MTVWEIIVDFVASVSAIVAIIAAGFALKDRRKAVESAEEAKADAKNAASALDKIARQHEIANEREGRRA